MTWPLVSRRAFDLVVDERDRLRAQNDRLIEHQNRIERREAGLPEVPREKRPVQPMPRTLRRWIEGHGTPEIRRALMQEAHKRYAGGQSWESIEQEVTREPEQEDGDDA